MGTRTFSGQVGNPPPESRNIENDAPAGLRLEVIDSIFDLANTTALDPNERNGVTEAQLYRVLKQSMGLALAPDNPYNGFRIGAGRQMRDLPWARFYDLVCRWWQEFPDGFREEYVRRINQLLAAYRIVWDLRDDGTLHRVMPAPVQAQVDAVFAELGNPRFEAASTSLRAALDAYDERPQRGRDACKNGMDALESVGKTVFNMPTATFGNVLDEMRGQQRAAAATISVLQRLYDMANNHFRHGMVAPFTLLTPEVDFFVFTCMAGILLIVRL
ncbi:MAG TPA: hypothetical protein VMH05_15005 [Bryobacteraceae bacterium]|nr:hypothetical protein [Bryobacteraceae bacterium]